jgi:hypothetical protein
MGLYRNVLFLGIGKWVVVFFRGVFFRFLCSLFMGWKQCRCLLCDTRTEEAVAYCCLYLFVQCSISSRIIWNEVLYG